MFDIQCSIFLNLPNPLCAKRREGQRRRGESSPTMHRQQHGLSQIQINSKMNIKINPKSEIENPKSKYFPNINKHPARALVAEAVIDSDIGL